MVYGSRAPYINHSSAAAVMGNCMAGRRGRPRVSSSRGGAVAYRLHRAGQLDPCRPCGGWRVANPRVRGGQGLAKPDEQT